MVSAALEGEDRFHVSAMEIGEWSHLCTHRPLLRCRPALLPAARGESSGRKSYSSETIEAVKAALPPDTQLFWIAGSDVLASLHKWHKIEVCLSRPPAGECCCRFRCCNWRGVPKAR